MKIDIALSVIALMTLESSCMSSARPSISQPNSASGRLDSESFSLESNDGLAKIEGQIDYPSKELPMSTTKIPLVVMMGGTGFFDRDYQFGNSQTEHDLLFKELANTITASGYAVARYDFRGVRCSKMKMPVCLTCKTSDDEMRHYVQSCIDNKLRSTITWDNMEDDFATVYKFAQNRPRIDPEKIVVFAHSEGTMHIANLFASNAIHPRGLVFMGMVAESPYTMIRWQWSNRLAAQFIRQISPATPNKVTNDEIQKYCQTNSIGQPDCDKLKSPDGFWTIQSLTEVVEAREYIGYREELLTHNDDEPFKHVLSQYGAVYASYGWWKRFFKDDVQVVAKLARYDGAMSIFNGDIDAATPSGREFRVIAENIAHLKTQPRLHSIHNSGHSLSADPMVGPIPEEAKAEILNEIARIVN